jgi:parallel beta-helix repeat protein
VRHFGAVGDGVTSDRTAIQAALSAVGGAGGGVVYLPGGTYLVSTSLQMSLDNVALIGAGVESEIKLANGSDTQVIVIAGDGVMCRDFAINGNRTNQTTAAAAIQIDNTAAVNSVELRGLRIKDVYGQGIRSGPTDTGYAITGLVVADCNITNTKNHAILLNWDTPGARIIGNYIDTVDTGDNGVWIGNESNHSLIEGNVILNVGGMGIEVWHNLEGHVSVVGNVVRDADDFGISLAQSPYSTVQGNTVDTTGEIGIEVSESDNSAVTGNTVLSAGTNGIALNGDTTTVPAISRNCSVVGNTIDDAGDSGISLSGIGGGANLGYGHVIADNVIRGTQTATSGHADIRVVGSIHSKVTISGNHIVKDENGNAIDGCDGLVCVGNRIEYQGSLTGIAINNGNYDDALISGNIVAGTLNTGITIVNATNTLVIGNRIDGTTSNGITAIGAANTCAVIGNVVRNASGADINNGSNQAAMNLQGGLTGYLYTTTAQRFNCDVRIDGQIDHNGTTVGFYGTTPAAQPTVTGSKGGNAALASLLTALATLGLVTDSTT